MPSDYVIADIEDGKRNAGLLTRIKQQISKAFGAEAEHWEEDLKFAKQGAGFLVVRCASEAEAQRVVRLLKPEHPRKVRRYGKLGIEKLVQ